MAGPLANLVWEEPPSNYAEEIVALRTALQDRPGEWARTHEDLTYTEAVRWCDRYRARGLSASRRLRPDGTYHVYARWLEIR